MRAGRELNTRIAKEIFGFKVERLKGELTEVRPNGNRPLRNYANDMLFAWEVAAKMKVTLIPIEGEQWFAFVGPAGHNGWDSPQAVLQFLETGDFATAGASLDENPALAICIAAVKAVEKRAALANKTDDETMMIESNETLTTSTENNETPLTH